MRCFIGVKLKDNIARHLALISSELRIKINPREAQIKWVKPESIHLTLKFLGNTDQNDIVNICRNIKQSIANYSRFQVQTTQVGSFGKPPKTVFVGINDNCNSLAEIAERLDTALDPFGFVRQGKKFQPHLTLCRIKSIKSAIQMQKVIDEYNNPKSKDIIIDSICLFESFLTDKGAEYTVIFKQDLCYAA